jgi:hypothetical protein
MPSKGGKIRDLPHPYFFKKSKLKKKEVCQTLTQNKMKIL